MFHFMQFLLPSQNMQTEECLQEIIKYPGDVLDKQKALKQWLTQAVY